MPCFDKFQAKDLKDTLYHSYIHDARLESLKYSAMRKELSIEVYNPIFNIGLSFTFLDVGVMFAISSGEVQGREIIISLTVEDDATYLQQYIPEYSDNCENTLYLLFQMLSGDELHIVARAVVIEDHH